LEVTADQASGELAKTNSQIEQYEQESRVNQVRKENIVSQHVELKRLREELTQQEERRREAEQKRAELERAYCEEEMEKVTGDYQNLQRRLDNLVGKTLSLARVSIDRAKLQPLERAIIQEPQL
jgi:predicted nuclease with TOPRIM domain